MRCATRRRPSTGIEASLTGHLVFCTLHTNSAVETVVRLLDMGLRLRSTSPTRCWRSSPSGWCGASARTAWRSTTPSRRSSRSWSRRTGPTSFQRLNLNYDDDLLFHRGKGCAACNNTGYRGRAAIHEVLVATDPMKKLIQSKARVAEMVKVAKARGDDDARAGRRAQVARRAHRPQASEGRRPQVGSPGRTSLKVRYRSTS